MNKSLPDVVGDILEYYGAVVNKADDDSMEFIVTVPLAKTLNIPEYGKLSFTYNMSLGNAIPASYDSDLFTAIKKIFSGGKLTRVNYSSVIPGADKLAKGISERINFSNAAFSLNKVETAKVVYLLILFKYTALSDDKKEGFFHLLINGLNFSTVLSDDNIMDIIENLNESGSQTHLDEQAMKAFRLGCFAANKVIKERLSDFIKSLEKRLNRDIKRVYDYYQMLSEETNRFIEKRAALDNRLKDKGDRELNRLRDKLDAIETEKKCKIQDLVLKYALKVEVEPISIIRVETQSHLFWTEIKRRMFTRQIPLTYNPLVRKFDPLVCEGCFYPRGKYYICDDRLHILCEDCFPKCAVCGKQYCSVCYRQKGCPKCKRESTILSGRSIA